VSFPTWAKLVLAIVIAAIDYTQTTSLIALSNEAKFGIGLVSTIAGVIAAFQTQATRLVRRARGLPA
jgi:hypothetical protein